MSSGSLARRAGSEHPVACSHVTARGEIEAPARRVPVGARNRNRAAVVFSSLGAASAALVVALWMAPTGDEIQTLLYVRASGPGQVLRMYRAAPDVTVPSWYLLSWLLKPLTGTGIVGTRLLAVAAWSVGAALLAHALRALPPAAAIAGALLPSATMMLFLGGFARPYALVFALSCGAAVAWQSAMQNRRNEALALLGLSLAAATTLHFVAAALVVPFVVATALVERDRRRRRSVVLASSIGLLPLVFGASLVDRAVTARLMPRNADLLQALVFYPSVFRPLAPAVAAGAICAIAICIGPRTADRWSRLPPVEILGWCLLVLLPPVVLCGIAATSGRYTHRYSAGAVVGAALVTGHLVARAATRRPLLGPVAAAVMIGCIPLAVVTVTQQRMSRSDLAGLDVSLRLDEPREGPILVTDALTYELLRSADPELAHRLYLAAEPMYPGERPRSVQAADVTGTHPRLQLVGFDYDVDHVLRTDLPHAGVRRVAATRVRVPTGVRTLVHIEVTTP